MMPVGNPQTVGELRELISTIPDEMPLHHRGSMGDHPPGLMLIIRRLAVAKGDPDYFADIVDDPLWSNPKKRKTFGSAFDALCTA